MHSGDVRVIMFQEGEAWVAQCLEHDIAAQADDLDELHMRFALTLRMELRTSLERSGRPFGGIEPAPRHFHELWEKRSGGFTPARPMSVKDDGTSVNVELALCA